MHLSGDQQALSAASEKPAVPLLSPDVYNATGKMVSISETVKGKLNLTELPDDLELELNEYEKKEDESLKYIIELEDKNRLLQQELEDERNEKVKIIFHHEKTKNEQLQRIAMLQQDNTSLQQKLTSEIKKSEEIKCRLEEEKQQLEAKFSDLERTMNSVQSELQAHVAQLSLENAELKDQMKQLQDKLAAIEGSWKIRHTELSLSKNELGRGAWGVIWVGEFRGQRVAVKQMHELIISEDYLELLHREINTMSQLRHPNLLQFIGAVLDHPSGNPMIITEVMDTSLRKAYESKELTPDSSCRPVILSIMRDVAVGLNYLHCLPDPIIHRDVSSANVLLESKGPRKWKTKISDFGSAKFARVAVTEVPGAAVYSAPESHQSVAHRKKKPQTPKMDSFSYGVLLCEVISCKFPKIDIFDDLLQASSPKLLHDLIVSCINEEPDERPTMSQIIKQLDFLNG